MKPVIRGTLRETKKCNLLNWLVLQILNVKPCLDFQKFNGLPPGTTKWCPSHLVCNLGHAISLPGTTKWCPSLSLRFLLKSFTKLIIFHCRLGKCRTRAGFRIKNMVQNNKKFFGWCPLQLVCNLGHAISLPSTTKWCPPLKLSIPCKILY